jgi:hypothetical protein
VYANSRKKTHGHKRQWPWARHPTCILFPLGTTSLLVRCSDLWEVCIKTFVKHANFLPQHLGTMSWHQARFHEFMIIFLSFWDFNTMVLNVNLCPSLDTNVFENYFRFPAQGINLHTMTQIWFSKPWWFVVACTCTSNLNYGHYMAINSFNVSKRSNQPRKFSTLNMTFVFVYVNSRKNSWP